MELIWNSILEVISESISITISDRIVGTSFCLFLQNLHHLFLHQSRESKSTSILGPIISSSMTLLTISPKTNNTIIQLPLRSMKAKPSQEKRMHTSLLSVECQCENYLQPSHTSRNMRWIYTCYLFVVFLLLCVFFSLEIFVWCYSRVVVVLRRIKATRKAIRHSYYDQPDCYTNNTRRQEQHEKTCKRTLTTILKTFTEDRDPRQWSQLV